MAHLWFREPATEWAVLPLTASEYALSTLPPRPVAADRGAGVEAGSPRLVSGGDAVGWAVLAGAAHGVRINGRALSGGLRLLEDRDEIRLPGVGAYYFSTASLPRVTVLPNLDTPLSCPRCKLPLAEGDAVVRCPGCSVVLHEGPTAAGEDRRCWSYASTCAMCSQSTAEDAGFRWTPEDI